MTPLVWTLWLEIPDRTGVKTRFESAKVKRAHREGDKKKQSQHKNVIKITAMSNNFAAAPSFGAPSLQEGEGAPE